MKGIVLAGGRGTRLYPLTYAISKQLLPVYKHPMIYYPIRTLASMGIRDILIITIPDQQEMFRTALKNIQMELDVNLTFTTQAEPRGLAEAFIIAEEWLQGDDATLILGDNIIINNNQILSKPNTIYTFPVIHPERYGVVTTTADGRINEIVEKPEEFISNDAVIGLYVLSNRACTEAKKLVPSTRNELEIVDLIREMDKLEGVKVQRLQGFWFDAGNHDDLLDCANLVRAIEQRSSSSLF